MRRTKFKKEYYALGYYIDNNDFGFIRHGSNLQALLQCKGNRGQRIIQFTPRGLNTIYKFKNKKWDKIEESKKFG